jgi:hypothetical protein
MLLMLKGHLKIPEEDPKSEWPVLQGWLKDTRAAMSKYEKEGCGGFVEEPQYYNLLVPADVAVCSSNCKMNAPSF